MSIATEILSLRRDQSSSVSALIGALEWERAAHNADHKMMRHHAVLQIADVVLSNVAAHAAEALSEPPAIRKTRRAILPFLRKRHRSSDPGELRQRRLFA